ncbi:LHFPL tetraspan subfamily member 6 protein-like [Littorina saxatilis]|uniref:LHFPL tetraspan subfamily member 6 protein-like n=1 Tax=Littorina saxatilis TaxID=31220 RepID=UPI0038B4C5C4
MAEMGWPGVIWLTLSMLAAMASSCGFFLPYWLRGFYEESTPVFLGTFRRCNYPRLDDEGRVELVQECGRYTRFYDIPSIWWQISTVACGTGAAMALLVATAGLTALCVRYVLTRGTAKVAAVLQLIAGLLMGGGVAVYPLGWGSREVQRVCGFISSPFELGTCQLYWAFYLTASAGGLTLLCSILALCAPSRKTDYS